MAKKRKTRQEKKIAELRRKLTVQKRQPQEAFSPETPLAPVQKKPKLSPQKEIIKKGSTLITLDKTQIKKALLKTLILSALAISLEFVVYLILRQA